MERNLSVQSSLPTAWRVQFGPYLCILEGTGRKSKVIFLTRCEVDDGPVNFSVKYELSVFAADGLTPRFDTKYTFMKGNRFGWWKFLKRDEALLHRKADFLPQDTLSVQCKMWRGEGNVRAVTEITARNRGDFFPSFNREFQQTGTR
ncbi:unnamed protein product [Larinioides sclopetarius]|uniref:MATH domain-containing protein n=1 Tax=Larinioides sclopetarius TaxID=280406 RepID=A0AAV2BES3_9ARAC